MLGKAFLASWGGEIQSCFAERRSLQSLLSAAVFAFQYALEICQLGRSFVEKSLCAATRCLEQDLGRSVFVHDHSVGCHHVPGTVVLRLLFHAHHEASPCRSGPSKVCHIRVG